MRLAGIFLLLFFSYCSFSQKVIDGYIIDFQGDTLKGKVIQSSVKEWYRKCLFVDQQGNEKKYLAKNRSIAGFGFDQTYFQLNDATGSFMRLMVGGGVSLYTEGTAYYISQDDQLFEIKPESEEVYVNGARYKNQGKRWKSVLVQLASSCGGASEEADRMVNPSDKGMINYVSHLNSCRDAEYFIPKESNFVLSQAMRRQVLDGYIIDMNKDTVRGKLVQLSSSEWSEKCIFIDSEGEELNFYSEDQSILGFGSSTKHFLLNSRSAKFMKVIIDGDISLHEVGDIFYLDYENAVYEIKVEKEEVYLEGVRYVEDKKSWRGVLNTLAAQCENARQIVSKMTQPSRKNLSSFVQELSKCENTDYTVFRTKKKTSFDISLGAYTAIFNYSRFISGYDVSTTTEASIRPSVAGGFNLQIPFRKKELNLRFGVLFSSYKASGSYTGERTETIAGVITRDVYGLSEVLIEGSVISIPASIDYPVFDTEKARIALNAGLTQTFLLNASTFARKTTESSSPVTSSVGGISGASTDGWISGYSLLRTGYLFGITTEKSFNEIRLGLKVNYYDFGRFSSEDLKHHGFDFAVFTRF